MGRGSGRSMGKRRGLNVVGAVRVGVGGGVGGGERGAGEAERRGVVGKADDRRGRRRWEECARTEIHRG